MILIKRVAFVLSLFVLAGLSFFLTSKWLEGPARQSAVRLEQGPKAAAPAVKASAPAETYCEMTFPVDNCPAYPGMFAIGPSRQLRDTWEGSDKSHERCLRRADEFHAFCKFQGTVTARFYSNGRVAASRSVP